MLLNEISVYFNLSRGYLRGTMAKVRDCEIEGKRVKIQVTLLRSLSGKYLWEIYEPPYLPSYGLNSTTPILQEGWL